MRLKYSIIYNIALLLTVVSYAQTGKQKKADYLFEKLSYSKAAETYYDLINKKIDTINASKKLGDSYYNLRNPDSAAVYYKKIVSNPDIDPIYYYKYAQVLKGIENYDESRIWFKKYAESGGTLSENSNDSDFLSKVNSDYFLKEVKFNSEYSDFGAYEFNGTIYFASSRNTGVLTKKKYGWNGQPFLDIYTTQQITDSVVSHKNKLKGKVNTVFHEGSLTITNDGKTMYFSRNDFIKNNRGTDELGITNLKIYKASYIEGKWKNIEELPFNSSAFSTGHPALNKNNNKLYFTSDRPGGYGGSDIYVVSINENGNYSNPENLGENINTAGNESFPFLDANDKLYFSSDGHQGLGLLDIFETIENQDSKVIGVKNIGKPINSSKDDFSFFLNPDGLTGYFSSNRENGMGSDDIYAFDKLPQLIVEGTIVDIETKKPITNSEVVLVSPTGEQIASVVSDKNGHYEINVDRGKNYGIKVLKEGYIDLTSLISTKRIDNNISKITENIELNPKVIETIQDAEFYPIYFDYNKAVIRKDDTNELDRITNFMVNKYPNMVIKIYSYTDSRGSQKYNLKLSQERAIATYNYLVEKGVEPNRILEFKGLGEENLANNCDDKTKCTEEEHQLNRRTEFIILGN
ncbi:OmpA family protein [Neotamlana laminarinivorans]|uniref:OmpA family protein n=1 Tax=Neotamlana laminarinivorans TaxID=2883124 RepID=A0A9X1HXY2_9FLAO|nr:OmpA family protein [Tamlana laminarinivorans]MCB4797821.1 OmpA family protein [Tamlana laminarinivorans]